jgi:predicted ArsR family transcriptional regulator
VNPRGAPADPTRRVLLDRLRERNGQSLGELCEPLEMARQSATQHLGVLEEESTMADRPSYVYVTYIESSPERVWEALTDPS